MLPRRQNKLNLPWSSKGFHPLALNVFWNYHACNSCIWVPQLSSVWKDGSQNHTVFIGKGSNTQKCWKTKEFVGTEEFSSFIFVVIWRTADSLTCSGQTRDSWTTITKQTKNTAVDDSGNNTVLIIKCMWTFEQGHFYKFNYHFLLWTICKHILCEISYSGQY